jgi:hypothetical protein
LPVAALPRRRGPANTVKKWAKSRSGFAPSTRVQGTIFLICVSSRNHHEHIRASDVLAALADQAAPVAPA